MRRTEGREEGKQTNWWHNVHNIMIKVILALFPAISLFGFCQGTQLDYEEVKLLGGSCPPYDTCLNRSVDQDTLFANTCECKPSCMKYGTCCIDSPSNQPPSPISEVSWPNTPEESCIYLMGIFRTLVVKHKCKPSWKNDDEVKSRCESPEYSTSFKDPLASLPVTNPKTSTTYKNYFCALCHDVDEQNLVFWNINVTKFIPKSDYEEEAKEYEENGNNLNFTYNSLTNEWGIMKVVKRDNNQNPMSMNNNGEDYQNKGVMFQDVSIFFTYPANLSESIISCSADLISDCHSNWTDESVRKKCHSYMAMIYSPVHPSEGYMVKRFRNVHCAICNFAGKKSDLVCFYRGRCCNKVLPYSWLLDVNPPSDDRGTKDSRCDLGEVYDPFFMECRVMKCIKPGYIIQNGKCKSSKVY